jgi:hypothetical protein
MLPVLSARRIVLLRCNGPGWATAARGQSQPWAPVATFRKTPKAAGPRSYGMCQFRTRALQQAPCLFDHLMSARK